MTNTSVQSLSAALLFTWTLIPDLLICKCFVQQSHRRCQSSYRVYRWVYSDQLPDTQRGSHPLYKNSLSKQLKDQSWSILYQDGSGASGLVYADKVVIGKSCTQDSCYDLLRYRICDCYVTGCRGCNFCIGYVPRKHS